MRVTLAAMLVLVAACSGSVAGPAASGSRSRVAVASPSPSARPKPICRIPVYWDVSGASGSTEIHAAFVSIPDGAVTDAGIVPNLPQVYGATFLAASNRWLAVDHKLLSPDGTRYVYWQATPNTTDIHVVDVATGADRMAYSGPTFYLPIAFEADGIYAVHAINPRQGAFEKLFRLDPAGGGPVLVPGSDRHMNQWGWVLVSDGAAWGIDAVQQGNDYSYSVLRLDLATGQVALWFQSPFADFVWPLGVDLRHRLYVQGITQGELWRMSAPGQTVELPNPGSVKLGGSIGTPDGFFADAHGVWMAGPDGLWLFGETGDPKHFAVNSLGVTPAGPCL